MIPEKDAYIYLNEDNINIFLYIKLTKERLQNALLTYVDTDEKPYLCVFFDEDYRDYLGRGNEKEIKKMIEECSMKNILTTSYDELILSFNNLSRGLYEEIKSTCEKQLKL